MKTYKWVKIWFVIIALIPAVGVFNYVIDPYGFNKKILIPHINSIKEDNTLFTIKYKMPNVKEKEWDNLMLGTSRIGLMDTHLVDQYLGGKTFTISQPGSVLPIQFDSFFYAVKFNHIKNLVYGIDFMSFNKNLKFNNDYLQYKNDLQSFANFYNYDLYINFNTFKSSLNTLFNNASNQPKLSAYYSENGMRNFPNYQQQLADGHLDLQTNINRHIQKYFKKGGIYDNYEFSPEYMAMFKKIVSYCQHNAINLYVYIPPIYYEHFYALKAAGLQNNFATFKKELVQITDFIDFTGVNSITTDKENFWDSSHLRKSHTDMIMNKVLQNEKINQYPDFGFRVNSENIEMHLQKQRTQYQDIDLKTILMIQYNQ